jgi:diguanylate cyclase (GGDEF)-like protein
MKNFEILEKLTPAQRLAVVIGSVFPPVIATYDAMQSNGNVLACLFLFYIPLTFSVVLLGLTSAVIIICLVSLGALVNLLSIDAPFWILITFVSGFLINYYYWQDWIRQNELEEFRFQKMVEEIELNTNDAHIAHDKVGIAHQANLIKIQRYTALNELARSLATSFKTQDVVVLLIETISKTFMAQGGVYTLLLFESSVGKDLHAVRYSVDTDMEVRLNRERLNPDEVFNTWVASQGKPLFISDAANDFRFLNVSSENKIKSLVAAPLMAGNEILGLIRMESEMPNVFRQDDARLLSNFCDLGTVALEHVALYKQTIELAITDGLTGLYVQRYYKERVRDEIFRALEHKLPLCLLMIDVDHFKKYNDRYGHLIGDKVLKVVAEVLKESVRTVDLVARYGGEEFSVLLLKTPWDGAKTVSERILQRIAEQEIMVSGEKTGVTVSIGVSELNPSFVDAESFVDSADQALYQAKADGRNCIRLAKPGVSHE